MKYTHLIVSRINIKWLPQSKDEIWLNNRIHILDNTLRSSINAQTNKNFKFVTLWGYEPIGKVDNEYQILLNSTGANKILNEVLPRLLELIDEDYVLTTRIDSDNCLKDDFVEKIYNNIMETELPFYYDIKNMDIINTISRKKTTWTATSTSGFISIMEKKNEYKCIPYMHSHGHIGDLINGVKLDDLGVLLTIHSDNVYMTKNLGFLSKFDESKYNLKL